MRPIISVAIVYGQFNDVCLQCAVSGCFYRAADTHCLELVKVDAGLFYSIYGAVCVRFATRVFNVAIRRCAAIIMLYYFISTKVYFL